MTTKSYMLFNMASSLFTSVVDSMTSVSTYYTDTLSRDNIQQALTLLCRPKPSTWVFVLSQEHTQCWVCAAPNIPRSAPAATQLVFIMSQGIKKTTAFREPGCEGLYKNVNE